MSSGFACTETILYAPTAGRTRTTTLPASAVCAVEIYTLTFYFSSGFISISFLPLTLSTLFPPPHTPTPLPPFCCCFASRGLQGLSRALSGRSLDERNQVLPYYNWASPWSPAHPDTCDMWNPMRSGYVLYDGARLSRHHVRTRLSKIVEISWAILPVRPCVASPTRVDAQRGARPAGSQPLQVWRAAWGRPVGVRSAA